MRWSRSHQSLMAQSRTTPRRRQAPGERSMQPFGGSTRRPLHPDPATARRSPHREVAMTRRQGEQFDKRCRAPPPPRVSGDTTPAEFDREPAKEADPQHLRRHVPTLQRAPGRGPRLGWPRSSRSHGLGDLWHSAVSGLPDAQAPSLVADGSRRSRIRSCLTTRRPVVRSGSTVHRHREHKQSDEHDDDDLLQHPVPGPPITTMEANRHPRSAMVRSTATGMRGFGRTRAARYRGSLHLDATVNHTIQYGRPTPGARERSLTARWWLRTVCPTRSIFGRAMRILFRCWSATVCCGAAGM